MDKEKVLCMKCGKEAKWDDNVEGYICTACSAMVYQDPIPAKPVIMDSGNRTEFDSGAVRDIQDDKGRCDLLPLGVIGSILIGNAERSIGVLDQLEAYKRTKDIKYLYGALHEFIEGVYCGDRMEAIMELSIHFRDGAVKYGENNWQKGLPEWSYLSSAIRHFVKWWTGYRDERHDRAFMWNIVCLIWTIENKEPNPVTPNARQEDVLEGGSCK